MRRLCVGACLRAKSSWRYSGVAKEKKEKDKGREFLSHFAMEIYCGHPTQDYEFTGICLNFSFSSALSLTCTVRWDPGVAVFPFIFIRQCYFSFCSLIRSSFFVRFRIQWDPFGPL